MANTNVDFDFESIFSDIPEGGADGGLDFADIFSDPAPEKKEAAPVTEEAKPAKEAKAEAPAEEKPEDIISEVDAMVEEEIKAKEAQKAETAEKAPAVKEAEPVTEAEAEMAAEAEAVTAEERFEQEAHVAVRAAAEDVAPKAKIEADVTVSVDTDNNSAKSEESAEKAVAEEEPQVEVEVAKPKKTRRSRKSAAKSPVEGEIITEHSNAVDDTFINSLLLSPSKTFLEDKAEIEKLMSEITLEVGMSDAVVDTMIAKNMLLLQKIETIAYGYHVAYENLTNKDTGLIKRVQENAMLSSEGTEKDKKLAASVAVANYEYVKGHKVDLYQHANALRGAAYFVKRASEFQKATSIALSMFRKHAA